MIPRSFRLSADVLRPLAASLFRTSSHVYMPRFLGTTSFRAFSTSGSHSSPEVPEAEVVSKEEQELRDAEAKAAAEASAALPVVTKKGERTLSFQAETRQILDIMANSLYTDKEVFIREIISNASDALEKARYLQTVGKTLVDPDVPLDIRIFTDESKNLLIIQDSGIGMTDKELIENLGTIAKSGSKAFMKNLKDAKEGAAATTNIIGQFGVGFYSTFMVSDRVDVFSTAAAANGETKSFFWSSDGNGQYELAEIERQPRGTKVVIHLKESCKEFSSKYTCESIIRKYSNFVGFPIHFNSAKLNNVGALWLQPKDSVSEESYLEFYKYFATAYDTPSYRLHFSMDSPIDIHALFYIPERHMEKFGMGRMDPGVSIYSRKVLIKPKAKEILPEWMRFVKGVVDSEDIPLNISRESLQDSRLISKLNTVLSRKIIKFLVDEAKSNPAKYKTFYDEFGPFIKEGIVTDFNNKTEAAKLLRFETSLESSTLFSLDEYISRMPPEQKEIYYMSAPNRDSALHSPYFEQFKSAKTEVLFLYSPIDDFVMKNLGEYNTRKFKAVEDAGDEDLKVASGAKVTKAPDSPEDKLLLEWLREALEAHVSSVESTDTLVDSPAIIRSPESAALRKMMKYVESAGGADFNRPLAKQKLEVNLKHPILEQLGAVRKDNEEMAKTIAEQLYDNALIAADLLDNPRGMVSRINRLMEQALAAAQAKNLK